MGAVSNGSGLTPYRSILSVFAKLLERLTLTEPPWTTGKVSCLLEGFFALPEREDLTLSLKLCICTNTTIQRWLHTLVFGGEERK